MRETHEIRCESEVEATREKDQRCWYDLDEIELQELCTQFAAPKYRAKQLREALLRGENDPLEILQLPKLFREQLVASYPDFRPIRVRRRLESKEDGTVKYLFELFDGSFVEAALMHYRYGASLCISTQVGCRMGCTFCASAKLGFERNLSAGEMLEQMLLVAKREGIRIHNVVLMGIGEPLDNLANILRFVSLAGDEKGPHLGQRHISVSTCGLVDRIRELVAYRPQFTLSISLHAPTQEQRKIIMPIAKAYPLDELLDACRFYLNAGGKRISFEYIMLRDFNDRDEDARALSKLLKGLLCHVNLIPANEVPGSPYRPSTPAQLRRFQTILEEAHIPVTLRRSLGQDIEAACGQLRRSEKGQLEAAEAKESC